ncbi:hypothetical protein IFM89_022260, partial [Coptis chinensis]
MLFMQVIANMDHSVSLFLSAHSEAKAIAICLDKNYRLFTFLREFTIK